MPVNHKMKLAFCHIPRTGGRSIAIALGMQVKGEKHEPVSFYREKYPEYVLFTVFRNYEDRIKNFRPTRKPNRKNIVPIRLETDYFLDETPDYILSFKQLEEDLNSMLRRLGHKQVRLPQITDEE